MSTLRLIASAPWFVLAVLVFVGCAHQAGGQDGHDANHASHAPAAPGHHAGNVTEHVDAVFAELDVDGDGALSRDDVKGHRLASKFDEVDGDANGSVSHDELMAFGRRMHGGGSNESATEAAH